MKSKFIILAIIIAALIPSLAQGATPEFRAIWVHNWLPGLLCDSQVDQTIKWAKESNINTLIVQVRRVGDAYYDSKYEPRADNIQAGPDFDPLACVIKQARANGLEVHAWFNACRVGVKSTTPLPKTHMIIQHPEWLSKNDKGENNSEDGQFLDPGVPEARAFLVKVIADLVTKYDIDGLMLDYIRYPGKNWGYNDISVARFNTKYGRTGQPTPDDPLWCDWRRDQVTATVRAIYKEVHRLKPSMKVSASTIAWGNCPSDFTQSTPYKLVFQDWRRWMQEGILDANMPMNYKDPSSTNGNKAFADWVSGAKKWSYGRHVYTGLMLYKDMIGATQQIQLARDNGAEGVVGFAFSQIDTGDALAATLKSTVFTQSATLPTMPWIKSRPVRHVYAGSATQCVGLKEVSR